MCRPSLMQAAIQGCLELVRSSCKAAEPIQQIDGFMDGLYQSEGGCQVQRLARGN